MLSVQFCSKLYFLTSSTLLYAHLEEAAGGEWGGGGCVWRGID